jgi:NAD(P)-dependent dehydrogenase (short-subunit alcohol dehydrogenase family)
LVTGAGLGIGRATAIAFGARGAAVGVLDRDADAASETVRRVEEAGGRALSVCVDVGDEQAMSDAVAEIAGAFGSLDFAVNNAGIHGTTQLLTELPAEEWDRVLTVNLSGVFFGMKYQLAAMMRQGAGAIVNVSSMAGLHGLRGRPAYVASKHGVVGLTRAAALDYAPYGVRVNCVCPGGTLTPLYESRHGGDAASASDQSSIPLGRLARADEIADVVVWLCSDAASYMTAAALPIDGGVRA